MVLLNLVANDPTSTHMLIERSVIWTPSPCHCLHIIVKETFRWSQICWRYLLVGGYCEDSMETVGLLQGDGLLIHSAQHAWAAVLFDLPYLCIKKLPLSMLKKKKKNLLWANNWLHLLKTHCHLCLPAICWIWNNLIPILHYFCHILSLSPIFPLFFRAVFKHLKK